MKFIANKINDHYLRSILPSVEDAKSIDCVYAAIAYGSKSTSDDNLIANCIKHKLRLDIWMRYDHTVPVTIQLLEHLLNSHKENIFCRLIPDKLHSKVIWWQGYGAYIGSANLTDQAWNSNIEAGLFLNEDDLQCNGMASELDDFFERLKELDVVRPLSQELIDEMSKMQESREGVKDKGKDLRSIPVWQGLNFLGQPKAQDKRKENFRKEWNETLTILREIGKQLENSRPCWVSEDIPVNWQVDQFLHAYYDNHVSDGQRKPHEEFHQKNKKDPRAALVKAIDWWTNTSKPLSNENINFEHASVIHEKLKQECILKLTEDEFKDVCDYTYATRYHATKISMKILGKPEQQSLSVPIEERLPLFTSYLLDQKNQKGWGVRQLLHFVLYEGEDSELWERLYLSGCTEEYKFPHYGLESLAEVAGWARPEIVPPRNSRTSKALRALGYDCKNLSLIIK